MVQSLLSGEDPERGVGAAWGGFSVSLAGPGSPGRWGGGSESASIPVLINPRLAWSENNLWADIKKVGQG